MSAAESRSNASRSESRNPVSLPTLDQSPTLVEPTRPSVDSAARAGVPLGRPPGRKRDPQSVDGPFHDGPVAPGLLGGLLRCNRDLGRGMGRRVRSGFPGVNRMLMSMRLPAVELRQQLDRGRPGSAPGATRAACPRRARALRGAQCSPAGRQEPSMSGATSKVYGATPCAHAHGSAALRHQTGGR